MTKKEAAKFLDCSEKTIERFKSQGLLSAKLVRVRGDDGKLRQILDFNEKNLEKLKQDRAGSVTFPIVDNQTQTDTTTIGHPFPIANIDFNTLDILRPDTRQTDILGVIFERFEMLSGRYFEHLELNSKQVLLDKEAAQISGLPKAFIKQSIKEKLLPARRIGGRWRIKRTDLDEFIQNL